MASCLCSQDVLEPVLRELAGQRGADLRFGTEVTDLAGDSDGVTATLRGPGGAVSRIRAGYVIAADGARSPARERLGIPRSGRGALSRSVSIYFRADLAEVVRGREFNLCQIENPAAPGAFASVDGDQRWLFSTPAGPDRSAEQYAQLVAAAIGAAGTGVEVLSVLEWESGMFVADRLRAGRIFLAGDAAHVMPPYAALGANTGIQDAHNLAWKLALVLAGDAAAGLLDSYHAERHAAGWFAAEQSSVRRFNLRTMNAASTDGTPLADPLALIFGCQYASGAVISDGSTAATDRLDLHGQPGTRLPHQWLAGGHRSTLDLLDHGRLTLLTGPAGAAWALAAPELARPPGLRLSWSASRAGSRPADSAPAARCSSGPTRSSPGAAPARPLTRPPHSAPPSPPCSATASPFPALNRRVSRRAGLLRRVDRVALPEVPLITPRIGDVTGARAVILIPGRIDLDAGRPDPLVLGVDIADADDEQRAGALAGRLVAAADVDVRRADDHAALGPAPVGTADAAGRAEAEDPGQPLRGRVAVGVAQVGTDAGECRCLRHESIVPPGDWARLGRIGTALVFRSGWPGFIRRAPLIVLD